MRQLDVYVDGSYSKTEALIEDMLPVGYTKITWANRIGTPGHVVHGGIVVIDHDTEEVLSLHRVNCTRPSFVEANNVGGEVIAAGLGFQWATYYINKMRELGDKEKYKVVIYHDYMGISEWIKPHGKKKWKANSTCSRVYIGLVESALSKCECELEFIKVKAHSGNKWNEIADLIAGGSSIDIDKQIEVTNI